MGCSCSYKLLICESALEQLKRISCRDAMMVGYFSGALPIEKWHEMADDFGRMMKEHPNWCK